MKIFTAEKSYTAKENTIAGTINLYDYIDSNLYDLKNAWINIGGWQSWNPCFEIPPAAKQPWLNSHLIKPFNKYLNFPCSKNKISKNIVLAQFVTYLRWHNEDTNQDFYLALCSVGNLTDTLPPVQFVINREQAIVKVELCDKYTKWSENDVLAKIEIFTADSYFQAREKLESIYGSSNPLNKNYSKRFDQIQHLGTTAYGWESWYNHYANINERLILEDLNSLKTTENILNMMNEKNPVVFQIDDGWEQKLGDWEIRKDRFPKGLAYITQEIEKENYIPGLWIAPFIIDLRSNIANQHPDWLLRDKNGNLVSAGFNFLWGANGTFYCLDLSVPEVLEHLDKKIEEIINQWGFRYLKFDFLYAGFLDGNRKYEKAAYKTYDKAIKLLTRRKQNNKGQNVCYLGCGAPFEASFIDLPLSRIGCDTYEHWDNTLPKILKFYGRNSCYLNIKDTIGHGLWDKIIFANDPDVLFIRKENCSLNDNEKILIASVNSMFGSQIMYSDDPLNSCSEEEIKLSKEITSIRNNLINKEYAVINTDFDKYSFWSKDGSIKGTIELSKKNKKEHHKILFTENTK